MAAKKLKLTHPGKILREEFMEPVGLSAYALAKALVVPLPRVNDIVREKRAISPEMAVLLSAEATLNAFALRVVVAVIERAVE